MIVGKFYSYYISRIVFSDPFSVGTHHQVDVISKNQPFLFLEKGKEIKGKEIKWGEICKVLTANGIVGWIHIGYPDNIKEVNT
jgi:hypothetical protein